jgi:uncharacterized membrane-anchored protein
MKNILRENMRRFGTKNLLTENNTAFEMEKELSNPNTERGSKIKEIKKTFSDFVGVIKSFKNVKEFVRSEGSYNGPITGIGALDEILKDFASKIKNKDEFEVEKDKNVALSQIKSIDVPESGSPISQNFNESVVAAGVLTFLGLALLLSIILHSRGVRRA